MNKKTNTKPTFDLEERMQVFARDVRRFIRKIPKSIIAEEDGRQLIRSSGSVGANYIEANESLSKKDFLMRIKICRKEAKESRYWLTLVECVDGRSEQERQRLANEVTELMKIFGSMVSKL